MVKTSKYLLWRVEWIHIRGYRAPSVYVEAETKRQAIKLAKDKSRLSVFPKSWYCRPEALGPVKRFTSKKKKVWKEE